jgi:hypothetical protein
MPITALHKDYVSNQPLWSLVRDCIKGERAIKEGGTTYLPRPSGQFDEDYKRYMERVHFTGFTRRTAGGLHGNIFSRLPVKNGEMPETLKEFLDNVDLSGTSIDQFASVLCWDVMKTNWGGILVDHLPVPEGMSQGEKERMGLTSYMSMYSAENITNWRYGTVNGSRTLVLVVLREIYLDVGADEFCPAEKCRYRVLRLAGGVYTQQVFEKVEDGNPKEEKWEGGEVITPLLDGKPLDFIPFYTCPGKEPEDSMLLDLAYENIGHYQKTADYEQDIHYTALHTPYVAGMDAPKDPVTKKPMNVKVGSSSFIFLNGTGDKVPQVGYLETSGSGGIIVAIHACEERMAILGARIISVEKKGVETAEAARIHRAGENAVLGAFAQNVSEILTQAARFCALYRGVPKDIAEKFSITLNVDYEGDLTLTDEKRVGMLEVEAGLMTRKRYLREFCGMTDKEAEAELEEIDAEEKKLPEPVVDFDVNEIAE